MKVYIVTQGYYSDYHIEAVFSKRSQAELYIAVHNNNDDDSKYGEYYIEPYLVDDCKIEVDNQKIYYHYEYNIKSHTIINKSIDLRAISDYVKYGVFHHWSTNENLTEKEISDAYIMWQYEVLERVRND